MGAKLAPSKRCNPGRSHKASKLLNHTWWEHIKASTEVVKDCRYLGAHLASKNAAASPTINKRWDKAMQQLRKLKYRPATVEAKAKAILVKVYAVAFYGVEAAEIPAARVAQLTVAVIDVFRSRNDNHNVD